MSLDIPDGIPKNVHDGVSNLCLTRKSGYQAQEDHIRRELEYMAGYVQIPRPLVSDNQSRMETRRSRDIDSFPRWMQPTELIEFLLPASPYAMRYDMFLAAEVSRRYALASTEFQRLK